MARLVFFLIVFGHALMVPVSLEAIAAPDAETPQCHLLLGFDDRLRPATLLATATITIPAGQRLALTLPGLTIEGATLADQRGRESELSDLGDVVILPPAEARRSLRLSYSKRFVDDPNNRVERDAITLTHHWHPLADRPMRFSLEAELPPDLTAISESDTFPLPRNGNRVSAVSSRPTTAIHFAAAPYLIEKRQVSDALQVFTLFFPEDAQLANGYLEAAVDYLRRYQRELGPYPFNHYAIVASRLPSGLGIPTFSLFGQSVLRLPFIKDTSLDHEIVHSWFGNSVEVDNHGGNWCEGLTAFLSDHRFREERGEGVDDRHESLVRYHSYVDDQLAIPLSSFISADHRQPLAEAKRAVGYQRGAMFFHELREKIGPVPFARALRRLADDFRFRKASWDDLEKTFSRESGEDLRNFFEERLSRPEAPDLAVSDVDLAAAESGWQLSLALEQKSSHPFSLRVPIAIDSPTGRITITKEIREKSTPLLITVAQRPTAITIDPEYSFFRKLSKAETAATWSRFLGGRKRLAILASESDQARYQPLLEMLGDNLTVLTAAAVSDQQLAEHHLLFLGRDQPPARALFGSPPPRSAGLTLEVRRNPLAPQRVAVLLDLAADNRDQALLGRLGHYGKYSFLAFDNGANSQKRPPQVEHGIRVELERLPMGGATSNLSSFPAVARQLAEARVIYLGETHTSYGDHLLQLRLIEALYRHDPRLAIGMEMFPASVQEQLNRYLLYGEIDSEKAFVKASRYLQVWRYDYRLYRDIIALAKTQHIPILGLNLEQEVVSTVFREGGIEALSPQVRAALVPDRDLDLPGYSERLRDTHAMHQTAKLAAGSSAGFLQAQALWDETMAENIAVFLRSHPEHRLVVLAGRQHTRKDNGIPPRVARRLPVRQFSVVSIGDGALLDELDKIADFYFLTPESSLPQAAKLGVTLGAAGNQEQGTLTISGFSPHGQAESAGLKLGDVLLTVNGEAIGELADIQLALLDARPGDSAELRIRRQSPEGTQEHSLAVVLTGVPVLPPHP